MIDTKQIAENYSLAKDLEALYKTNRREFIRQVKPKIRFAYSVNDKTKGKFIRRFNGEYNLIEANPNDVITHTDTFQQVKPYHQSTENHINVGQELSSRVFRVAEHFLSGGRCDVPEIYVNGYGTLLFTDGRHKTALAADCGLRKMLFVIDNDGLNNLTSRKLFNYKLIISGG